MKLGLYKTKDGDITYTVQKGFRKKRPDGTSYPTTKNIERIGTHRNLLARGIKDPEKYARARVDELNALEDTKERIILVKYDRTKQIPSGKQVLFEGGYLFVQKVYYDLGLHEICYAIGRRRKYQFNLNEILSRMVYARVIHPTSKLGTYEYSKTLLEGPGFDLHHIYRALTVLAQEDSYIQERLYKNSKKYFPRNDRVLYYDCTNYFFEIEEEDEFRKYGHGKQNRSLPLVEMGLFMDGNGIPLAYSTHPGNTNEQITLKPLEQKIIEDFEHSKFVICTDSGLSSGTNRWINSRPGRAFITAYSLKKMGKQKQEKFLKPDGWRLDENTKKTYNLDEIGADEEQRKLFYDKTFYKEEWFIEKIEVHTDDGNTEFKELPQRYIVTFSFKYQDYLRNLRNSQLLRAKKLIEQGEDSILRVNSNDSRKFISRISTTNEGEVAENTQFFIDEKKVDEIAVYDGYYAVVTTLEDPVSEINKISHNRWEIEESFRILKQEFSARPVHVRLEDHIKAHFLTCFLALYLYRFLELKLGDKYTCSEIIDTLKDYRFNYIEGEGYTPAYTRTDITDDFHEAFGFRTDYEIVSKTDMKKILKATKGKS